MVGHFNCFHFRFDPIIFKKFSTSSKKTVDVFINLYNLAFLDRKK